MSKSSKFILFALGGLAGFVVLAAAMAALLLGMDAKPRVEAAASKALGMDVNVGGQLDIGFLPGLHVALADVHIRNRGAEVASAAEVDLGIALLPLLRKEIRINRIGLKRLRIAIERDRDGKLNVDRSSQARGTFPALRITSVSFSDAVVSYVNRQAGEELEARACNLDVRRLRLSHGESSNAFKNLSFTAKLACDEMRTREVTMSDVRISVDKKDAAFDLQPVTMRLFGGNGSGTVRADLSGPVPVYGVSYRLAQFRIEEFFKALSPKSAGEGSMDFSAKLSLRGKTTDALKRSVEGAASLHGENLRLEIGDIDKKFSRYESSQSFNLVDVGAFFFAGPIGLGVTKGYDFARIFEGSGGSTTIRTLVSDWQVKDGVAHATDVAMATQENRVALKGALDFVNGRFDEVTVALVDTEGCSRVQQKVRGPFLKPEVEEPSVLRALAGPTSKLLGQARNLFGGHCEVFYAGSVTPPH